MGLAAVWYAARPRATAGLPLEPMVVQLGGFRDASSTLRAEAAALNDGLRGELQAVPGLRLVDAVGLPEVPLDSLRQTDVAWVVRGAVDRLGDSVGATVRLLEVGTGAEVRSTTQRAATPADLLRQATALGPRSAFGVVRFTLDSVLRDRNELALGGDRQQLALRNRARQAASRAEEAMLTVGPRRMLEEFALADSLLHSGTPRDASVLLDYERARLGVHRGIALFGARQFFPDSSWLEDPKSVFLGTLPLAASVIRRAPQFADALLIRGGLYDWLYEVSGDPAWGDSALADLQQASALAGSRADIWEQRAMLEMQGGRTREALYSIEQGLAADHLLTHAEGLIYRQAVVQGRLGQFDAARESCRRGVAGFPGSPYFVVCEAEVLVRVSRDARDATRLLLLADSLDSHGTGSLPPFTPSELRLYAAAILARAANGDSARSLYAAVARGWKVESSGDLLLDAIYVQQELGDLDSAVTLAAHVAREWPSSTAWLNMLPWFAPVRQHPGYPAAVARATGNRP